MPTATLIKNPSEIFGLSASQLIGLGTDGNLAENEKRIPASKEEEALEKKRQISQMYQYYNYLIFEKNKESFNDINPDLRKMTYKYDPEVKSAFMTVQASPEVIKAAVGPIPSQKDDSEGLETHKKKPEKKG